MQHKENLHNKTINDTFVIQPMSHCGLFLGRECSLKLICYHFNDNLSFLFPFLPSFPLEYFGLPISRLIFQNRPRTRIFDISYNVSPPWTWISLHALFILLHFHTKRSQIRQQEHNLKIMQSIWN